MARSLPLLALAGCAPAATGCSATTVERPVPTIHTPLAQAVDVAQLVAYRTPYVGNASNVINQTDAASVQVVGKRWLSLQTDRAPYGLTWRIEQLAAGVTAQEASEALRSRAVLVMACTDNLGSVIWEVPGLATDGHLARAAAESLAGRHLTGQCTEDGLRALVARLG